MQYSLIVTIKDRKCSTSPASLALYKNEILWQGTCVLANQSFLHNWTFHDTSADLLKPNCPRTAFKHLSVHHGRCYGDSIKTINQQLSTPVYVSYPLTRLWCMLCTPSSQLLNSHSNSLPCSLISQIDCLLEEDKILSNTVCPFYRVSAHDSCHGGFIAREPSAGNIRVRFSPAVILLSCRFSKCSKFLADIGVLCDTRPVFKDTIKWSLCTLIVIWRFRSLFCVITYLKN